MYMTAMSVTSYLHLIFHGGLSFTYFTCQCQFHLCACVRQNKVHMKNKMNLVIQSEKRRTLTCASPRNLSEMCRKSRYTYKEQGSSSQYIVWVW